MSRQPRIVGIGGTQRPNSSTELLARAVLDICASHGADVRLFGGEQLAALPHYDPYSSDRTGGERDFVEAVRQADGIVIASPSYHGGVSGLIKNAIDLLEDLRADERPYFDGRPVGLLVSAAGWQAGGVTLAALRGIVHAMRGWPTPMGIAINSIEQKPFAEDGSLKDSQVAGQLDAMARQLAVGCVGLSNRH
ncbi:NADPH-dependent FMN reductase [Croceicoccus marinus]|uniref:NAD(P)H-dependent oxidoreductase n=1 Tax=Croceicoccus marinus TaxID=450378 RepID=A0A1Z1FGW8_9SPHN|nr:NADPH-dependent FMN reductase [Croceicoccus marinus]ARU18051.1 NADPH-dependent FMN reductase [Croceicoccus marinus]QNE07556.1 NAD(P)H-dependent oxidoreductase [Croceicoccus marinus]